MNFRHLALAIETAVATAVAIMPLGASPAAASCAEGAGPQGSAIVFTGTPTEGRRGFTRFTVQQVWSGPQLANEVWVQSGQQQPTWPMNLLSGVSSSTDMDFSVGTAYVVGASSDFRTSACSAAAVVGGPTLTESPRIPARDGLEGADPPIGPVGQSLWIAGVLAALGAVGTVVFRIRRAGGVR
jgi:hypothetical protein